MKKCSFYTRKNKNERTGGIVERVNGWTDGVYNYYRNGEKLREKFNSLIQAAENN